MKILFVCTGNTCRSPMAEAMMRRLLEERSIGEIEVRSAGTGAYDGAPASEGAYLVGLENGIDLSSHRAQRLTRELVSEADLILTMSPQHRDRAQDFGGGEKVFLLGTYAGREGEDSAVNDPFGAELEEYRTTYRELESLIQAAISRLQAERSDGQR
ncbi:MAG: low molecular weight protein arginine phosphatase [Gemmatimonadota bacterium]